MKTIKGSCIMCGINIKYLPINQPWCDECIDKESQRHGREDYLGGFQYKRPPKYVLSKDRWSDFGYE